MASNSDKTDYLNSLEVFGKTSDQSVKDELKKLATIKKIDKISQDTLDSFIEGSMPINRKEIQAPISAFTSNAMIIGDKVNPAITLADSYTKVSRANYNVIDVNKEISRITNEATTKFLNDIPKAIIPREYFDIKETVKDLQKNFEDLIFNWTNFDLMDDTMQSYLETISEITRFTKDDFEMSDSHNFILEKTSSDEMGGSFLYNHIVQKEGNEIVMKPKYGKSDDQGISRTALVWVKARRRLSRSKQTKEYAFYNETTTDKKKIDFKVKENLALRLSETGSEHYKNRERIRNNPFITDLLNAGPNLNANMFDVYLRFNSEPSHSLVEKKKNGSGLNTLKPPVKDKNKPQEPEGITPDNSSAVSYMYFIPVLNVDSKGKSKTVQSLAMASTFMDIYSLSVRTASVTVPMLKRESESIKVLNTSVEVPSNKVMLNLEGSLSIDCDANAYVNDMFLALAGLQRDGKYRDGNQLKDTLGDMFDRTKGQYPFQSAAKLGFEMTTVDLVVSAHSLSPYNDKTYNPGGGGFFSNILYVFEDVRFLGNGSDITFNPENSSSQSLDIPFIAKRLNTYYKPDNLEYAVTSGVGINSLFNSRNMYGRYYDEESLTEKKDS